MNPGQRIEAIRLDDDERASRASHASHLAQHARRRRCVVEHCHRDDDVEACFGEWERLGVAGDITQVWAYELLPCRMLDDVEPHDAACVVRIAGRVPPVHATDVQDVATNRGAELRAKPVAESFVADTCTVVERYVSRVDATLAAVGLEHAGGMRPLDCVSLDRRTPPDGA